MTLKVWGALSCKNLSKLARQAVELVHSYSPHATRYSTCFSMGLVGATGVFLGFEDTWAQSGPPQACLEGILPQIRKPGWSRSQLTLGEAGRQFVTGLTHIDNHSRLIYIYRQFRIPNEPNLHVLGSQSTWWELTQTWWKHAKSTQRGWCSNIYVNISLLEY